MVSSIVPGAVGAGPLGVDARLTRTQTQSTQNNVESAKGDRVDVGGPAAWAAARDSVQAGLAQVHRALAAGHEAQSMLVQAQDLARAGASQDDLAALMRGYADRLDAILGQAGGVAAGEDIAVYAEPGAAPVIVHGVDLRLKQTPGEADVIAVSAHARIDDPALPAAAQRSLENLQGAMEKLFTAARALEAHQGFLGAAELANAANADLDAESARLLALQVSQSLAGRGAIANAEPQSVLALFKA
jgi:hypothetical protein